MDKVTLRLLTALLGCSLYCSTTAEDGLYETLESYYQHVMNKANDEFGMMLENWATDFIGLRGSSGNIQEPIACASNMTDELGNVLACVLPISYTTNNKMEDDLNTEPNIIDTDTEINEINNVTNDEILIEQDYVPSSSENRLNLKLNSTSLYDFYERMRFLVQDPMPVPDKTKLSQLPSFLVMFGATKQVEIYGLSQYKIEDVQVNTSSLTLINKFKWDNINITGLYEVDMSGPRIHMYGNGPFSINVSDISFGFNLAVGENSNQTLRLDSFEVDIKIGNISIKLENLLDGSTAGETVNNFLSEIVPQALNGAIPQLKGSLENIVIKHANNYLSQKSTQNVTNFLNRYVG